jgi:dTDP-4-dehydrorhamnose reductase
MLRLAQQGKPLRVVADQVCTPSYMIDVATAAAALIQTEEHGLYHLTNAGSSPRYEFARTIFEKAGVKATLSPTTTKEYGLPRPPACVQRAGKCGLRSDWRAPAATLAGGFGKLSG